MEKKVIYCPYTKTIRDDQGSVINVEKIITFEVTFNYDPANLNIHIKDSCLADDYRDIDDFLLNLSQTDEFKQIEEAGYTRSIDSLRNEWIAHNVLFNWGKDPERTGSVDLDQNESLLRRLAYWFLCFFF